MITIIGIDHEYSVVPSRNSMAVNARPLGFALKTGECLRVAGDLLRQELRTRGCIVSSPSDHRGGKGSMRTAG